MDRRTFISSVTLTVLAAPLAAEAQPAGKMARVGILGVGPAPSPQELAKSVSTNPFWLSMRHLGWVEGQNMVVERRFGESADQLRTAAADLVRLKVDVLFVASAGLAKILQLETKAIPIVATLQVHSFLAMISPLSAWSFSRRLYRIFQGSRSSRRTSPSRQSRRRALGPNKGPLSGL
jgi:hypothetical protein